MVDTAPLPPRPVREKGYAAQNVGGWWTDLSNEETPELRWPLSIHVFDRMRRQDAQVASVLQAMTTPIIRTQWRIDGTGCSNEVTEFVASSLGLPIVGRETTEDYQAPLRGRDRFSWDEHLRLALLMLPFGHMYFEQIYRWDPAAEKWRLRKLGPRMPRSIARVNVARDGGLVSIQQFSSGFGAGIEDPLPVNRLVAYVLGREGGNWLGQSVFRAAYKNWLLKDRALRTWSTAIDRQGMGIPIATGADGASDRDMNLLEEIAQDARSGENSGAALPHGSKFELIGVQGTLPDIDKFVRYNDEQIARSGLGHFLNLGTQSGGQVGSYNLGSVLSTTFNLALESLADLVADTASAHIIEDIVDLAFGPTVPAPQMVFDEIGVRQSELDRVREAAGLTSDADLTRFLRNVSPLEGA